jgi:hypothetical protein
VRRGHQLAAAVHELVRPGAAVAAPVRPHVLPVPAPPAGCRTAWVVVRISNHDHARMIETAPDDQVQAGNACTMIYLLFLKYPLYLSPPANVCTRS